MSDVGGVNADIGIGLRCNWKLWKLGIKKIQV